VLFEQIRRIPQGSAHTANSTSLPLIELADALPGDGYGAAMESPYTARMAESVKALAEASVSASPDGVEAALAAIEHRVTDLESRRDPPFGDIVAVFVRDCWTCRYCGSHTIALPVLRVLSLLYPNRFPHHPSWKAGRIHPAYLLLSTSLDHVRPGARGGSRNERTNLVTACWPCNSGKADFTLEELGWSLLDETDVRSDWDGLTGLYPALLESAAQLGGTSYHRQWLRSLRTSAGSTSH
jgi:5-methylcytosine-specific restriction endonuclease McrA